MPLIMVYHIAHLNVFIILFLRLKTSIYRFVENRAKTCENQQFIYRNQLNTGTSLVCKRLRTPGSHERVDFPFSDFMFYGVVLFLAQTR